MKSFDPGAGGGYKVLDPGTGGHKVMDPGTVGN